MNEELDEKAVSKSQQRFFGMVDAYKKGEMPNASKAIKKAAKGMTNKEVKDFAKTKHKGLPEHVDENVIKINETVLMEAIRKTINSFLNERGYTSWEAMEFRQQALANKKAREEAKKKRMEKLGITEPIGKKKTKKAGIVSVANENNLNNIIEQLKNRFVNQGKEMSGDESIRAMQQFMRYTDRELAKKNIAGGSIFTDSNRRKYEGTLGDVYDNVQKLRTPVMEIAYILKNTKNFDSQHLELLTYKIADLCENIPLAAHEILHHPAVIEAIQQGVPFWVGGGANGGGHNIGLRKVLKQFEKDIKQQTYQKIINELNDYINKGKDVMSYNLRENKLRSIIKETIEKMSLDDEMKLWDERGNDEFGSRLRKVRDLAKEVVLDAGEEVSDLMAYYCLDGNKKSIMKNLIPMLENYDMILIDEDTNKIDVEGSNNPEIAKLCIEMMQL